MINTYKLINFEIKTEFLIPKNDLKAIKKFDNWYLHLNYKHDFYSSKERWHYTNDLLKIINIQKNIINEILFIIQRCGKHKINLIK